MRPPKEIPPVVPCDHCGGVAAVVPDMDYGHYHGWTVECQNDRCGARTGLFDTPLQAAKAWNRRDVPARSLKALAKSLAKSGRETDRWKARCKATRETLREVRGTLRQLSLRRGSAR